MRQFLTTSLLAAALGACAAPPVQNAQVAGPSGAAPQPAPSDGGDAVLAAFGTPFLIIGKIPVCIVTVAIAAPLGAVSEVSDPATEFGHELRQGLSDGIQSNCGPPYVVTP
jgi:hypothetical protein